MAGLPVMLIVAAEEPVETTLLSLIQTPVFPVPAIWIAPLPEVDTEEFDSTSTPCKPVWLPFPVMISEPLPLERTVEALTSTPLPVVPVPLKVPVMTRLPAPSVSTTEFAAILMPSAWLKPRPSPMIVIVPPLACRLAAEIDTPWPDRKSVV